MSKLRKLTNEKPQHYGKPFPADGVREPPNRVSQQLVFFRLIPNQCKEVGQPKWERHNIRVFTYRNIDLAVKDFLLEKVFNTLQHLPCSKVKAYLTDIREMDFGFKSEPHPTLRRDIDHAGAFQLWLDEVERIVCTFKGRVFFYGHQIENRFDHTPETPYGY